MRVLERRACSSTGGRRNAPLEDSAAEPPVIREELVASRHLMRPKGDPDAGHRPGPQMDPLPGTSPNLTVADRYDVQR